MRTLLCSSIALLLLVGCGYYGRVPSSSAGLTLLPVPIAQQPNDWTCGPTAVKNLLAWYGRSAEVEELALAMGTLPDTGTTPTAIADWLTAQGWTVRWGEAVNATKGEALGRIHADLRRGVPTLVEWADWGGHWTLVVGYDTRGTAAFEDDVIILGDSSDAGDDRVDGLTWINAERFDFMWFEARYFGKPMQRVFVTAEPPPGTSRPPL